MYVDQAGQNHRLVEVVIDLGPGQLTKHVVARAHGRDPTVLDGHGRIPERGGHDGDHVSRAVDFHGKLPQTSRL